MTKGMTPLQEKSYLTKEWNRGKNPPCFKLTQKSFNNKILHGFHLVLTVTSLVTFLPI